MGGERLDFSGFFQYPELEASDPSDELAFLPHASERDWEKIFDVAQARRFSAGDVLIRAGEERRALAVLMSGAVEVVIERGDGAEPRRERLQAPTVTGELSFLAGGQAAATVSAVTDGEALRLDFDAFEGLAAREPRLGRQVLLDLGRILAVRLRRAMAEPR